MDIINLGDCEDEWCGPFEFILKGILTALVSLAAYFFHCELPQYGEVYHE